MYRLSNTFPTVYFFQEEDSRLWGDEKYPRREWRYPTEARIISSEVSDDSSEVSFDSSEELTVSSVEILDFSRGDFRILR